MKLKFLSIIVAISALFVFNSNTFIDNLISPDNKNKDDILVKLILQGLSKMHYEPQQINDDFSEKVFNGYVEKLDYSKRFLLQEDVDALQKYKHKLDDMVNTRKKVDFAFLDLSVKLINKRIKEAQSYYKEILSKPFKFDIDEMIELDVDKRKFSTKEAELKELWRKSLKHQTLTRLADGIENQEKLRAKKDTTDLSKEEEEKIAKTFETLESEARDKVRKNQKEWFIRMQEEDRSDWLNNFINSIAAAYDPHTNYLPPKEKENFDISLSGRLEGIGARLQRKDGSITVTEIVAGSASATQGELEAEDIIIKVAQGKKEPVDVSDMPLDDAVQLIRGKKGSECRLTVKKIDGSIKVIPIIRDIVVLEESYAKSSILIDEESGSNVGYIKLPKFYADFNHKDGRSCAKDVKIELTKLKKEGVCGVILDLRNNGGGSLRDVVDMAGLFIEDGPIVQVKAGSGKPDIFDDTDPQVHYEGPLVVMVNSFSASASEILAGAIQDYNRGIIIGSAATYGKGTVQRFLHLDRSINPQLLGIRPLGSLKLTIQKFYRVNGTTNQLKGVVPDIVLPDRYSYIDVGEKEQDFAMAWDEINPLSYDKWTQNNVPTLAANSKKRVDSNATFSLINESAKRLKQQRDETLRTLCLDKFRKRQDKLNEESKKYDGLDKEIEGLDVRSLVVDMSEIRSDTTKVSRAEKWHKSLKKDAYVFEALSVIKDASNGGCSQPQGLDSIDKTIAKPSDSTPPKVTDPAMLNNLPKNKK